MHIGVFVGAAQGGDQLFIHSLQKDNHYDNFNCSDNGWFGWGKIGEGGRGAELLLATHQRNFKVSRSLISCLLFGDGYCYTLLLEFT